MQNTRDKVFLQDEHLNEPFMQLCYGELHACYTSHEATTGYEIEENLKICHFV